MKTAARVYYEGRVQGVGFRATVRGVAEGFEVNGWVRNLADGRVEMLAQGESAEIKDFLAAIRESGLAGHIHAETAESATVEAELRGFKIR